MLFGYLVGFLAADPEERMTSGGKRVVVLRLGVKSRVGSRDETVWCRCNIWNNRYDKMLPYLKKGSSVIVAGELSLESYVGRDGTPQASISVSVDTLKFNSGSSRPEGKGSEETRQRSNDNVSIGFDGESLDTDSALDKEVYAGFGEDQQYASEDVPF
ncbi:single-stranded DNA-binding protein [Chlamydia suis]|uniref:single-stranded DNA-binding protein n=1 Tax=Chlamydia suis TaxID=83559 RepID=UPI0009B0E1B3|nr:single-stranded DNA-binding protein [Chlamydia suis]MEB2689989.1 single-stranded DNA-binding protein [Chlamydia suis]